jgi:GNAT superfamily N-acetyltransferase
MSVVYRPAVPADAAACIDLGGRTRENAFSVEQLAALGITVESWAAGIAQGDFPGHVAEADGALVGYCFGDRDSGEIIVLALLPAWEGKGIGKALLARMVDDF